MKLESSKIIDRPINEVYNLVKNDFAKLAPYLPNVDKVEVVNREEPEAGIAIITNHWYAKADLPSILKKFVKPEIFSWKDTATWKDSDNTVSYELESFLANDLFDANGLNTFKSIDDNKTELTITCEVVIHPEKVPGIPGLLAGKVKPVIDGLLEKILAPNLASLGDALDEYYKNA